MAEERTSLKLTESHTALPDRGRIRTENPRRPPGRNSQLN